MPFSPKTWVAGDEVNSTELNRVEQGVVSVESDIAVRELAVTGLTATASDSGTKAANTTALNAAIASANTSRRLLQLPVGTYYFQNNTQLTQLGGTDGEGCQGILGVPGETTLIFNNSGQDCIVSKGLFKRFAGLYLDNQATTTTGTTLRIKNCGYGHFSDLYVRADGASSTAIMLEQEYTATAFDAWLLVHMGCWYNKFENVTAIYGANGSAGGNVGDGLSFTVNANAVSVVNPVGEPAGTYTGSVSNNLVTTPNIEGKARGFYLDRAVANTAIGGQFIGCTNQIVGRNVSSKNVFAGIRLNQPGTNHFDLDSGCTSNFIIAPILFQTGGTPWSLGNVGGQPYIFASAEFGNFGLLLNDVLVSYAAANRAKIGIAEVGQIQTNYAGLKYTGLATNDSAIQQNVNGTTFIGAASGQEAAIRVNAVSKVRCANAGVAFNDTAPVGKRTLGAAATDAATTQTLANNLRQALIDLGLGQT